MWLLLHTCRNEPILVNTEFVQYIAKDKRGTVCLQKADGEVIDLAEDFNEICETLPKDIVHIC